MTKLSLRFILKPYSHPTVHAGQVYHFFNTNTINTPIYLNLAKQQTILSNRHVPPPPSQKKFRENNWEYWHSNGNKLQSLWIVWLFQMRRQIHSSHENRTFKTMSIQNQKQLPIFSTLGTEEPAKNKDSKFMTDASSCNNRLALEPNERV